jgi:hypothetical protein
VVAYADYGNFSYLAADFTAAYPEGRAASVVRELAWDRGRFLLVVDNVTVAGSRFAPSVLWHYANPPVLEGRRFTVAAGGARAIGFVLAPSDAAVDTVTAFKVGTGVYPPRRADDTSLGAGRVEVKAVAGEDRNFTFVQVFDIADNSSPAAVPRLVASTQRRVEVTLPTGTFILTGKPGSRSSISFN